jgi:hypothetical protein
METFVDCDLEQHQDEREAGEKRERHPTSVEEIRVLPQHAVAVSVVAAGYSLFGQVRFASYESCSRAGLEC